MTREFIERRNAERRQLVSGCVREIRRQGERRKYLDNCRVAAWIERFEQAKGI